MVVAVSDDIVTRLQEAERLTRNGEMDRDDIGDILDWCADEIERLCKRITELLETTDELRTQMRSWRKVAEAFDTFNEHDHNENCGHGSRLTGQTNCYCGRSMYEQTKAALDD